MPTRNVGRRRSLAREEAAWETVRGGSVFEAENIAQTLTTEDAITDARLVVVDLVDVIGLPVDGSASMIDNVAVAAGMRVLRAEPGAQADNGIWDVPEPPTDPWTRYRPELLHDGLRVVVTDGIGDASTIVPPGAPYGGYRETVWQLSTADPITPGTTPITFVQASRRDGVSVVDQTSGVIGVPGFPGAALTMIAFHPDCSGEFITPAFGIGTMTTSYSGLYWIYFSILGSHVATGGVLAGGIFKNGALEKQVFQRAISTLDEQHSGGTIVRLAGEDIDVVSFRVWDPTGVGFTMNWTFQYADAHLVARR